jgi:hypothetical protein
MPKRVNPNFEALIRVAAQRTGYPLLLVEKDYWIVLILNELVANFGDLIIFKGGTSLSKAWKLIERFSEDVDILLDSTRVITRNQKRKTVSEFRIFLETISGLKLLQRSKQGDDHASLWLGYNSVFDEVQQSVLVEVGFRGSPQPSEYSTINSIIGELLKEHGQSSEEYPTCQIRVLSPKLTLIEKLFALASAHDVGHLPRKTRHYYDAHCLLNTSDLEQFMPSIEFFDLVFQVQQSTWDYFGVEQTLEWLLNNPAFCASDLVYAAAKKGYELDNELYLSKQPPFELIYATVKRAIERTRHFND